MPAFYEPPDPDDFFLESPQTIKYLRQEFYCEGDTANSCRWFLAPGVSAKIQVYRTIPDPERGLSRNRPDNWGASGSSMSEVGKFGEFYSTFEHPAVMFSDPEFFGTGTSLVGQWEQGQIERPILLPPVVGSTDRINGDYDRSNVELFGSELGRQTYVGNARSGWTIGEPDWNVIMMFHMIQSMQLGRRVPLSLLYSVDATESGVIYTSDPTVSVIRLARVQLTGTVPSGVHEAASANDGRPFWGEITFGHL